MVAKDLLPAVQNSARQQGLTTAVSSLIGSIACPAEVPAQRLPLDTPVPTSLMNVHSLSTHDTRGTSVANMPTASYWVYKQLARSYLYRLNSVVGGDATYVSVPGTNPVTIGSQVYDSYHFRWSTTPNGVNFISTGSINSNWRMSGFVPGPTATYSNHGPLLPLGLDYRKDKYVLLNKGSLRVSFDPVALSSSLTGFPTTSLFDGQAFRVGVKLYKYVVPGEPREAVTEGVIYGNSTGVTGVDIPISAPGYYTLDVVDVTAGSSAGPTTPNADSSIGLRFQLVTDTTVPTVNNVMAPEVYEDPEISDKARVVASSLLLTNTTAVLNKEGVITGATVTPDTYPFELTTETIGKYVGATSHGFSTGMYLFQKPEREQLEFIKGSFDASPTIFDSSTTAQIVAKTPFFQMDSMLSYDVVMIEDPDTASPSTWRVRRDMHWEFRTTSQRYLREMPLLDEEVFSNVMRVLAVIPNHVDNPIHWAKIGRAINRAVAWTWRNRGKVINVGHILSDAFLPGAVATAVDRGLDTVASVSNRLEHALF